VNPRNRARTDARKGPRTLRDVEMDFDNLLLKDPSQLNTYKQDIVLWAHDDTVVPEGVYRYRMRVGVFNPTAGKGWFDGEDKDYADSVILWSDYTDVTEPVEIDPMIYFFPLDLAKNDESVSIQVSKFSMGNWKSHEFEVLAGQTIGHQVEEEKKKDPLLNDVDMMDPDFGAGFEPKVEPTIVDYTTNATLIDVVDISDWAGASLRARRYSDILYSLDGSDIRRLPTKRTNWPKEMQTKFDQIRSVQDMEVELTTKGHSYKNRYMDMNQDLGMEEFF